MPLAYTLISTLHGTIGALQWQASRKLSALDKAMESDALSPHPDDVVELDDMMGSDANALRELAHEIEMRRIELKSNALQYQLQAAE